MNIMNIEHISKIFGEKTIFDDASIGIQEGDKIGIVGINGTGKSTLLRMIAGDEVPGFRQYYPAESAETGMAASGAEVPGECDDSFLCRR